MSPFNTFQSVTDEAIVVFINKLPNRQELQAVPGVYHLIGWYCIADTLMEDQLTSIYFRNYPRFYTLNCCKQTSISGKTVDCGAPIPI